MFEKLSLRFKLLMARIRPQVVERFLVIGLGTLFFKLWLIIIHHVWVLFFTDEVVSTMEFLFLPLGKGSESVRTLFTSLILVTFILAILQYFFFRPIRIFFYRFLNWFLVYFPLERAYRIFIDVYIRSRSDIDPKLYFDEGWESGYRQRRFVFMVVFLGLMQFYFIAAFLSFINLIFISVETLLNPTEPAYVSIHRFRAVLKNGELEQKLIVAFPNKSVTVHNIFINSDQAVLLQPWLMLVYTILKLFNDDLRFSDSSLYNSLDRSIDYLYYKSSLKLLNVKSHSIIRQPFPLEHVPVLAAGGFLPILRKAGRDVAAVTGALVGMVVGYTVKGHEERKTIRAKGMEERSTIETTIKSSGVEKRETIRANESEKRETLGREHELRINELNDLEQKYQNELHLIANDRIMSSATRNQLVMKVQENYHQQAQLIRSRSLSNTSNSAVSAEDQSSKSSSIKLNSPLEEGWLICLIRMLRRVAELVEPFLRPIRRILFILLGL